MHEEASANAPRVPKIALYFAVGICLVVLALFTYWFAVANRYHIFLYGHLGATPFDSTTRGRYWMAGLVATGIILLLYLLANYLLGRLWGIMAARPHHLYEPPSWWRVWALCAPPLAVGILLITLRANAPVLPLPLALACVAATWIGLALALSPGAMVAQRPREFLWLAWIGVGIVPALLLVRVIELPARGIISTEMAYSVLSGSILFGLVWTSVWLWIYTRRHQRPPLSSPAIAGAIWSYLVLPLVHYWLFTPPAYRYISTASNFFAGSWGGQLLTLLVAATILVIAYAPVGWRGFVTRTPARKA